MLKAMSKKDKNKQDLAEGRVAAEENLKDKKTENKAKKQDDSGLRSELEKANKAIEEEKERFLRLFAEFENYKRRTGKERVELFKTASQDVMVALLPVLDDFDRALKEINRAGEKSLAEGVELISNKLRETLKNKGLEPIHTEVGEAFDAEIHEAVTQIPAPSDELKGKIVDVIEKGYKLGDKIIRFPKVVTGQ